MERLEPCKASTVNLDAARILHLNLSSRHRARSRHCAGDMQERGLSTMCLRFPC